MGPYSDTPPWEVEELGCFWQHCFNRLVKPYNEVADSLLNSEIRFKTRHNTELPLHEQPPIQRYFYDTRDLSVAESDIRDCLVSMGPSLIFKILREQDFITRRNLMFANSLRNNHVFPEIWEFYLRDFDEGTLPLLYPADKFSFGTDFAGLEKNSWVLYQIMSGQIFPGGRDGWRISISLTFREVLRICLVMRVVMSAGIGDMLFGMTRGLFSGEHRTWGNSNRFGPC